MDAAAVINGMVAALRESREAEVSRLRAEYAKLATEVADQPPLALAVEDDTSCPTCPTCHRTEQASRALASTSANAAATESLLTPKQKARRQRWRNASTSAARGPVLTPASS